MSFIRSIKKASGTYYAKVESYRENGKVKQKVVEYLGKSPRKKPSPKKQVSIETGEITDTFSTNLHLIHSLAKELDLLQILGQKGRPVLAFIYNHLLAPSNLQDIQEWVEKNEVLQILQLNKFSVKELHASIDYLNKLDFEIFESKLQKIFLKHDKSLNIFFSDVTDACFNISTSDSRLNIEIPKNSQKQIKVAISTSLKHGFPLYHKIIEEKSGSKNLYQFLTSHIKAGYQGIILHKGKSGKKNIKQLLDSDLKGIVGMQLSSGMKKEFAGIINTDVIQQKQNYIEINKTDFYFVSLAYLDGKLLVVYNQKQELLQRNMILFVEPSKHSEYAGYSFIYHNTGIDDKAILKKYYEENSEQQYFFNAQQFLTDFSSSQWNIKHFEAYIKICYLAFCIDSWYKFKLKTSSLK